jgi:hypothetical protein
MEEFVRDHIIVTTANKNVKIFMSLSGKEVLIKKDALFTGKGFKRSLKLNILRCEYFTNFNDYFPKGRRFMVMFVDGTLFGAPRRIIYDPIPSETPDTTAKNNHEINQEQEQLKLEQIMRTHPLVSKNLGEKYDHLFRSVSFKEATDKETLIQLFDDAVEEASLIFQTLNQDIINSIINDSAGVDLNESVHNYVELNFHDKIWRRMCEIDEDLIDYKALENLSVNQVSLPDKFKADVVLQSILEKRIAKAIQEFQKLELSTDSCSKIEVFVNTITILSNIETITVDADTLVGLLLLVVVHTGVTNLETHLSYVQSFAFKNIDVGMVGYALSTFEGLLYFVKHESSLDSLKRYSEQNREIFGYIDSKELLHLKKIADAYLGNADSSLKSRTTNGDSLLMQAIQSNDYDTWKLLIDYEQIYPMEDILQDININDVNLLNAALNSENFDIVDEIIDILFSSCSIEELITYLNLKDSHHRTIGHYLFYYPNVIPKLAPFIDWTTKDINGQTPLFAICRSYDTVEYDSMIKTVFKCVEDWYLQNGSEFDYEDHIDNRGNTLLHILNSNVGVLLKMKRLNVNESNKKWYTPLMIYAKYNRIENIKEIVKNESLDLYKTDKNHFTCVDHSKNSKVSSIIDDCYLKTKIECVEGKQIGLIRVRLDNNVWKLVIRGNVNGEKHLIVHSFKDLKSLIEVLKLEFPNSFLPLDYSLKSFEMVLNFASFNKLKLNKIVDDLNNFLQAMLFNKGMSEHHLVWDFLVNSEFDLIDISQKAKLKMMEYKDKLMNGSESGFVIQPEEISEINFFLKFSLKELTKFRGLYDKLFKIVNFQSRKAMELKHAIELFADTECESSPELKYLCKVEQDSVKELTMDDELCDKVLYLSFSSEEMIEKMNVLMNQKIFKWWRLYGELIELNNTYKKFKFVELKKSHGVQQADEVEGIVDVNEQSFQDLTQVTSFHTVLKKKSPNKPKPGFFTNFIESRRHKFEDKLLEKMKELNKSLSELSKDIKFHHETIAMELNNFFIFKADFMKLTMKRYIHKQIKDLKFSSMMLERGLKDMHI